MTIEECDILIVGAGPVGLLLAIMLRDRGINVKIVERQQGLYPLPRAVAFDHESRRLFGAIGISDELETLLEERNLKSGEDGQNFVWRDADLKLVVDLHCDAPTRSGYPFGNNFNQPEVEALLERTALKRGVPIVRGYAVSNIEQYPGHVEADFEEFANASATKRGEGMVVNGIVTNVNSTANGGADRASDDSTSNPLRIRASYLVGCDGANSTVRRLQEITTTDLKFENDWLIVDLLLRDGYVPPLVERIGAAQICDPKRPTTCVFAGKGRRRFEFMRLPAEPREELLKDETLWALLEPYGFTRDNVDYERKVIYTFNARWANEFYKGRVVLAGDALHLMPPFIGQGLNSGFRDAGALGWRLPLILSGVAKHEVLFQSYQDERLNHIRKLTEYCVQLGEVVCETDPVKSKQIHAKLRAARRRFDPPLGRPGTLTSQEAAGKLSLQRKLQNGGVQTLFDKIHGYGWVLLTFGEKSADSNLSGDSRNFFVDVLRGMIVSVSAEEDITGEYRDWFTNELGIHHAVLVRPDFYIFGHAAITGVNALVDELRVKMGAA